MSLDQTHYDVALLSTGLTQSIVSAALASAGLSVIHIDKNDYYADQWASLTLSELSKWANRAAQASSDPARKTRRVDGIQLLFPSHKAPASKTLGQSSELPEALAPLDRHYAISLAPTLLPATGPSIDCLIKSSVSSYATFRLLERICVASASEDGKIVLTSVPASKEDIFKTKTLSLIAKRKLMKLLMYIATEDWQSELAQDPAKAQRPFVEYLADVHKMSADLIDAVAYGVCLCPLPNETTQAAMARAKSHMLSVGRYGNSAYLVGQYGGAGELAQGYCRASAVKGGMFILDHQIRSVKRAQRDTEWEIHVDRVEDTITADYVVSSDELLEELSLGSVETDHSAEEPLVLHKAVLVLDRPIEFAPTYTQQPTTDGLISESPSAQAEAVATSLPPETGLVIFPPGSVSGNVNTVTVLMMGEGTFSCPKGQYVYYIQTESANSDSQRSAVEVLQPILDQIISLTSTQQPPEGAAEPAIKPLLQLTYRQLIRSTSLQIERPNLSSIPFPPPSTANVSADNRPVTSVCGLTDAAVHLAERVYYDILATRAPSSSGNSHKDKLEWVKQTVEQQKKDRKQRKGRHPSEYQGRGGRGANDGVTKDSEAHSDDTKDDTDTVVGFFAADVDTNDADDDTDGQ